MLPQPAPAACSYDVGDDHTCAVPDVSVSIVSYAFVHDPFDQLFTNELHERASDSAIVHDGVFGYGTGEPPGDDLNCCFVRAHGILTGTSNPEYDVHHDAVRAFSTYWCRPSANSSPAYGARACATTSP